MIIWRSQYELLTVIYLVSWSLLNTSISHKHITFQSFSSTNNFRFHFQIQRKFYSHFQTCSISYLLFSEFLNDLDYTRITAITKKLSILFFFFTKQIQYRKYRIHITICNLTIIKHKFSYTQGIKQRESKFSSARRSNFHWTPFLIWSIVRQL